MDGSKTISGERITVSAFRLNGSRDWRGLKEAALGLLERRGFDLVASFGESDAVLLVALDLCPMPPVGGSGEDNGRLRYLPEIARQLKAWAAEAGHPCARDPITWSRTSGEALVAAEKTLHGIRERMEEEVRWRREAFQFPFPVIRVLPGFQNNAKTALVLFEGKEGVAKVFRPGRERFLRNELAGLALSGSIREIPPALAHGDNWVVMPRIDYATTLEETRNRFGLAPLSLVRRAFAVVRAMHEAGFAHLDFHPEHVLVLKNGEIRLIDFDRLARVPPSLPFAQSPVVVGSDERAETDGPNGGTPDYESRWARVAGVSFESLMHAPEWRAHLTRLRWMSGCVRAAVRERLTGVVARQRRVSQLLSRGGVARDAGAS